MGRSALTRALEVSIFVFLKGPPLEERGNLPLSFFWFAEDGNTQ